MDQYKLYPNVQLGLNVQIEDFVIIGKPPAGKKEGELVTIIGDNAVIRSHTVIYAGNKIGDKFQTGHHVTIRENNEIGSNVSIGTGSCIEHHVSIADHVRIHSQAFIPEYSTLKESCWIGPNVVLTNARYPKSNTVKENLMGPVIGRNVKIGANSTILPGKVIGDYSLIGAGTVVVNDVPEGKVVAGNPGVIIRDIGDIDVYRGQV